MNKLELEKMIHLFNNCYVKSKQSSFTKFSDDYNKNSFQLLSNPNISLNTIKTNQYFHRYVRDISKNPNITLTYLIENNIPYSLVDLVYNESWDISQLYKYPYLDWSNINSEIMLSSVRNIDEMIQLISYVIKSNSINYIIQHIIEYHSNILIINDVKQYIEHIRVENLCRYCPLTLQFMEDNPNIKLDFYNLSKNENMDPNIIKYYKDKNWNMDILSLNTVITIDIIECCKNLNWDYFALSRNPNMSFKYILSKPDKNWDYRGIQNMRHISYSDIVNNLHLNWITSYIHTILIDMDKQNWYYRDMTDDQFKIFLQRKYNQERYAEYIIYFLQKKKITDFSKIIKYIDFHNLSIVNQNLIISELSRIVKWLEVVENPNYNWNYNKLSANLNITCDIICANTDKPWNYQTFSANPNITFDFIKNNPSQMYDLDKLQTNLGTYHPTLYYNKIINRIQESQYIIKNVVDIICRYV